MSVIAKTMAPLYKPAVRLFHGPHFTDIILIVCAVVLFSAMVFAGFNIQAAALNPDRFDLQRLMIAALIAFFEAVVNALLRFLDSIYPWLPR